LQEQRTTGLAGRGAGGGAVHDAVGVLGLGEGLDGDLALVRGKRALQPKLEVEHQQLLRRHAVRVRNPWRETCVRERCVQGRRSETDHSAAGGRQRQARGLQEGVCARRAGAGDLRRSRRWQCQTRSARRAAACTAATRAAPAPRPCRQPQAQRSGLGVGCCAAPAEEFLHPTGVPD
jgi:hypothetical protein